MFIIVSDDDGYFCQGMILLLRQCFGEDIVISSYLTKKNVERADIIILPVYAGNANLCRSVLHHRKKSVIVGIAHNLQDYDSLLIKATCMNNMITIRRNENVNVIKFRILSSWSAVNGSSSPYSPPDCSFCPVPILTEMQSSIISYFFAGMNAKEISSLLKVSIKTVYAHKYVIMSKFGVSDKKGFARLLHHLNTEQSGDYSLNSGEG